MVETCWESSVRLLDWETESLSVTQKFELMTKRTGEELAKICGGAASSLMRWQWAFSFTLVQACKFNQTRNSQSMNATFSSNVEARKATTRRSIVFLDWWIWLAPMQTRHCQPYLVPHRALQTKQKVWKWSCSERLLPVPAVWAGSFLIGTCTSQLPCSGYQCQAASMH